MGLPPHQHFVLSNTLQQLSYDGRFSPSNREWAKKSYVPADSDHNIAFLVTSHPAVLDGFVSMVRKAYDGLQLYGPEHCEANSFESLDYEGKVLVLSPDVLRESCWSPENQLWYAHDGFGCSPHAIGRSIRSTCLGDGEQTRWNRSDFVGMLRDEFLPEWAKEKLAELQTGQSETEGMKMSGIMICVTGVVVIVAASLAAGSVLYLLQRKKEKLKSEQINL